MTGTPAAALIAAVNNCDASVTFLTRVTWMGPPAPRTSLAPPSQFSIFLYAGRTSSQPQPLQPSSAQSSKFFGLPRTNSIPLMELDPPSTLPRVCGIRRPRAFSCGTV